MKNLTTMTKNLSALFVILFLAILPSAVHAQISLEYGYYITPKWNAFLYERDFVEDEKSGYSLSLGGLIFLRKGNYELRTGVSYNIQPVNQIWYWPRFACDIDAFGNSDFTNSYLRDSYTTRYIGIPLNLSYYSTKHDNFYVNFGAELLLKQRVSFQSYIIECGAEEVENSTRPTQTFETRNDLTKLSFGIGYTLEKERVSYFIEPTVNYSLMNLFINTSDHSHTNSRVLELGIKLGIRI